MPVEIRKWWVERWQKAEKEKNKGNQKQAHQDPFGRSYNEE